MVFLESAHHRSIFGQNSCAAIAMAICGTVIHRLEQAVIEHGQRPESLLETDAANAALHTLYSYPVTYHKANAANGQSKRQRCSNELESPEAEKQTVGVSPLT